MSGVAGAADRMTGAMDAAMDSLSDSVSVVTDKVAALRAEMGGVAGASRAVGRGISAGGTTGAVERDVGGRDGPRGYITAGRGGFRAGISRVGSRLLSIPALGTEIGIYEGFKSALDTNLYESQAAMMMGRPTTGAAGVHELSRIRALVDSSAVGTIFTEQQTAEAYKIGAATVVQENDRRAISSYNKLFPAMLRTAEVGAMQHLGTVKSNIAAIASLSHILGDYNPTKMGPIMDLLLKVAETTQTSFAGIVTAGRTGLPAALGAGVQGTQAMLMLAMGIRAGLGSRAGYGLGEMVLGLTKTGGPINAHLTAARGLLEHTLAPSYHVAHGSAHTEALHALGLLDAHNNLTVMHGRNLNLFQAIADIAAYKQSHTQQQYINEVQAAFGARGLRLVTLLVGRMQQLELYEKRLGQLPSGVTQQKILAHTPLQQLQQVWARLQDIANTMATTILPDFQILVGTLLKFVTGVGSFVKHHPIISKMIFGAATGWLAGGATGMTAGLVWGVDPTGVPVRVPGQPHLRSWVTHPPSAWNLNRYLPGHSHGADPQDMIHPQAWTGGGVHIDNLVIQGAPHDADQAWVERLMGAMAERMHSASKTNLGAGFGWDESPFTQGGPI